jgi:hypothetical protein
MMYVPPDLACATVVGTTGGVNLFAERNVLPAPGGGARYRVWAFAWAYVVTADPPPTKVRVRISGIPSGGSNSANFSRVGFNGIEAAFPGGWPLPVNQPVAVGESLDTAAGANRVTCAVWYTIEAV